MLRGLKKGGFNPPFLVLSVNESDMKNNMNKNFGFTLVEVMVVVAIVVVMASVAIPGMIRSKISANEALAVASCRTIINSCMLYSSKNEIFPESLAVLTVPISDPPYIEEKLANATTESNTKNGYWFEYVASGEGDSFTAQARPKNNLTGKKRFFFNEESLIHYSDRGSDASVDDPVIN